MFKLLIYLRIVYGVFNSFKVRTALAVFGVLLGAFSLILVNNLSRSLKVKVELEIAKFGKNTITVASGRLMRHGRGGLFDKATTMKERDIEMISNKVTGVEEVAPYIKRTLSASYKVNNISTTVLGVSSNYFAIKNLALAHGRFINEGDNRRMEKVCILGSEVKNKLFGSEDATGRTILIRGVPFQVVGVLSEKGSDLNGTNMDDMVYVPINTLMRRVANITYIDGMEIVIGDWSMFDDIKADITRILRGNHRLYGDTKDDFTIINPVDTMKMQDQTVRIVTFLGLITAGIAYLIGGLGIFSIMILSVSLRRTEIGIRRAVGARKKDIFRQFLLESGIVGIVGSAMGIIAGVIVSVIVFKVAKLPVVISPYGLLFSALMALFVGVFSGAYPSYTASKTDPINALRSI